MQTIVDDMTNLANRTGMINDVPIICFSVVSNESASGVMYFLYEVVEDFGSLRPAMLLHVCWQIASYENAKPAISSVIKVALASSTYLQQHCKNRCMRMVSHGMQHNNM